MVKNMKKRNLFSFVSQYHKDSVYHLVTQYINIAFRSMPVLDVVVLNKSLSSVKAIIKHMRQYALRIVHMILCITGGHLRSKG